MIHMTDIIEHNTESEKIFVVVLDGLVMATFISRPDAVKFLHDLIDFLDKTNSNAALLENIAPLAAGINEYFIKNLLATLTACSESAYRQKLKKEIQACIHKQGLEQTETHAIKF